MRLLIVAVAWIVIQSGAFAAEERINEALIASEVRSAFNQQSVAYAAMLDRVEKGKMTVADRQMLNDTNSKKRRPKKDLIKDLEDRIATLADGNWIGPLADMPEPLAVGAVGELPGEFLVARVLSPTEAIVVRSKLGDSASYLIRGWKTDQWVDGKRYALGGMAVVSGIRESASGSRSLIVEPVHFYSRRKKLIDEVDRPLTRKK